MIDTKKELENILLTSKTEEEQKNRLINLVNDITDEKNYYIREIEEKTKIK